MSHYVAVIVGPAGLQTYLAHGREVSYEHATHHPHPSSAWRAAREYRLRNGGVFTYGVIDTRDPEMVVPE